MFHKRTVVEGLELGDKLTLFWGCRSDRTAQVYEGIMPWSIGPRNDVTEIPPAGRLRWCILFQSSRKFLFQQTIWSNPQEINFVLVMFARCPVTEEHFVAHWNCFSVFIFATVAKMTLSHSILSPHGLDWMDVWAEILHVGLNRVSQMQSPTANVIFFMASQARCLIPSCLILSPKRQVSWSYVSFKEDRALMFGSYCESTCKILQFGYCDKIFQATISAKRSTN